MLCLACAGSAQPTTMRLLSSLPVDREKAHAQMDSATARPGDEGTRKPLPPKARKAETIAATAAAILGQMFSTSENVILGVGSRMEETNLVPGTRATVTREAPDDGAVPYRDANELVPWLRLTPPVVPSPPSPPAPSP